jgi:hypothetical protein
MKNTKTAFTHFDEKGIPHFDFTSIIPMPKVIPPKQDNSYPVRSNSFSDVCDKEGNKPDTN